MTDDTLTKAIALDSQAIVFRVRPAHDGVEYLLHSDVPISPTTRQRVCSAIDSYLSLSDDLAEFYAIARDDNPGYAALVRRLHGLHQVRFLTVAEIGVWALVSQRTARSVATGMKRRITNLGAVIDFEGIRYQAFPEIADLRTLSPADWAKLVGNSRKAEYLSNLVAGLDDIGEEYLRDAPYDAATRALKAIKGVGEFTAAAILLRGLGRMDHVPLEMPAFADAAARIYAPADPAALNADLRRRYGTHLGYWSYYLHTGLGALRDDTPACAA